MQPIRGNMVIAKYSVAILEYKFLFGCGMTLDVGL